jgi:hypothetical protein
VAHIGFPTMMRFGIWRQYATVPMLMLTSLAGKTARPSRAETYHVENRIYAGLRSHHGSQ